MEGNNEDYILQLPPEIRRMIFRSLPVEDVRKLRMTCKKFNEEIMADTLLMKKIWSEVPPQSCIEAASAGNLPFFEEMMEHAAVKNPQVGGEGETLLHRVAKGGGNAEICQLLLANVEDRSPRNDRGLTPLHFSAFYGQAF